MRERDDGDQFPRGACPPRGHADGGPLVSGLSAEHAPCRRAHGGTLGGGGSLHHQPLVIKYSPQWEETFHRRKRPVWLSWRMDETSMKVKGQWRYLYCAVDKHGQTIDFCLRNTGIKRPRYGFSRRRSAATGSLRP